MEEEYKMLREEIMFNLNKLHWYISIVSTVAIAFLAYIVQSSNKIILFSLFLAVLFIMEGRIYEVTKSNVRISTYMEVFLEINPQNPNWETNSFIEIGEDMCNSRRLKKEASLNFITGINTVCLLIGFIVFAFNVSILVQNISFINILFSVINLLILILLAYIAYENRGGHQNREEYIKHWQEVKTKIEKENRNNNETLSNNL